MAAPIISCITPTYGRHDKLAQLLGVFLAQDWLDRELLIYDDSAKAWTPPADPRVRYWHSGARVTIGAKRNFLAQQARGDVVVAMDDDDLYASDYLSRAVGWLHGADFAKLSVFKIRRELDGSEWLWDTRKCGEPCYVVSGDGATEGPVPADRDAAACDSALWGYGFSYCFRRAVALAVPFADMSLGEDYEWARRMRECFRCNLVADAWDSVTHVLHPRSSSLVFPQVSLGASVERRMMPLPLPAGHAIKIEVGKRYEGTALLKNSHTLRDLRAKIAARGVRLDVLRDDPGAGLPRAPAGYRYVKFAGTAETNGTLPWELPRPWRYVDKTRLVQVGTLGEYALGEFSIVRAWSSRSEHPGMLGAPSSATPWRAVGLGKAPTPGDYAMLWSPGGQLMSDGAQAFAHDGPINTEPSHDLAHMIVAANGGLQWKPAGTQPSICYAEYNAVMLEHLYDKVYRARVGRELQDHAVVPSLVDHGRWFVTKHFTPFPTSPERALAQFARGMSPEVAGRLGAHFFDMKHAERQDPGHMGRTFSARFRASDNPPGWEDLRAESRRQLELLRRKV